MLKVQSQLLPSAILAKGLKACPALNGQSWAEENGHSLAGLVEKTQYLAKKNKKIW